MASSRKISAVVSAISLAVTGMVAVATAANAAGPNCEVVLSRAMQGQAAIAALGSKLPAVATLNGISTAGLKQMLADPTFWLDQCGRAYYVEEPVSAGELAAATSTTAAAALAPLDQTFLLHSKADAPVRIFLDFDGMYISGGGWLSYNGGVPWTAPAYSMDADPAFSDTEKTEIQRIWQRVSEDYAPFNIDVTTEQPIATDLERADANDTRYGTTALITNDGVVGGNCGCGGIAYVGVFDYTGASHETYQPAWIVTKGVGTSAKTVSEATSHEVGHNLGLSHDGLAKANAAYYYGNLGWAPIMGVGYSEPIVQWSKGEYPDANQTQDDYAVMAANGAQVRADEDANNAASASAIDVGAPDSGVISTPTDSDWFAFTPAADGTYTFTATPATLSPNLDIRLELYEGATLLDSADKPMVKVNGDQATGLDASLGWNLTAGTTYYLKLTGEGSRTLATGGYSDYASLGQYTVSVGAGAIGLSHLTSSTIPAATVNSAYDRQVPVTGGVQPYNFTATGLPAWATLSTSGRITGTPTSTGSSAVTVTATDAAGSSASRTFTLAAVAAPAISTSGLAEQVAATYFSIALGVTGGASSFQWIPTVQLPSGVGLSKAGTLSGRAAAGTYNIAVQATDFNGVTASRSLTLFVASTALAITSTNLPDAMQNTAYSAAAAATGGSASYSWSATGLPAGLTMDANGAVSGTATTVGSYSVVLRVTDSYNVSATKTVTLNVVAPSLAITTSTLPTTTATASYSQTLAAIGATGTVSWSSSGLPAGLTLDANSGLISGAATTAGNYSVRITATDSATTATTTLSLTVLAAPVVTTSSLLGGSQNVAYSATLTATASSAPLTWNVTGLPSGLNYSTSTGVISGTPTVAGSFNLVVKVQDASGVWSANQSLSLTIAAPALAITTSTLPTGKLGKSYSATVSVTGGSGARTWAVTSGKLPGNLTLNTSTGVISAAKVTGTRGTFSFSITVTDALGNQITKAFSLKLQ